MAPARTRGVILVADEDKDVQAIAKAIFSPRGYTAFGASSGPECLQLALLYLPDIVVLDVSLPEQDGITVTRQLIADTRTRGIPILAVSGMVNKQAEALEAGCQDFLLKPVPAADLLHRIELALARESPQRERSTF